MKFSIAVSIDFKIRNLINFIPNAGPCFDIFCESILVFFGEPKQESP